MKAEFYHQSNLQHAQKRRNIRRSITNPKTGSFTSCEYFICRAYLLEQAHTLHPSVRFHRLSFVNYEIRKKTWNEKKIHLCTCTAVLPQKWTGCPKILLHPKGSSDPQCFREHTHHSWPGIFLMDFHGKCRFKNDRSCFQNFKSSSFLAPPPLPHPTCCDTHLSVHLYSRAGVISLSPFEWSYWAQD